MKRVCIAVLVVFFISCNVNNSSVDQLKKVTFETEKSSYSLNSTINIWLKNHSSETIGYNFCLSKLQRLVVGKWNTIKKGAVCAAILVRLKPGETESYKIDLNRQYHLKKTGTYRIVLGVTVNNMSYKLETAPFNVH